MLLVAGSTQSRQPAVQKMLAEEGFVLKANHLVIGLQLKMERRLEQIKETFSFPFKELCWCFVVNQWVQVLVASMRYDLFGVRNDLH